MIARNKNCCWSFFLEGACLEVNLSMHTKIRIYHANGKFAKRSHPHDKIILPQELLLRTTCPCLTQLSILRSSILYDVVSSSGINISYKSVFTFTKRKKQLQAYNDLLINLPIYKKQFFVLNVKPQQRSNQKLLASKKIPLYSK